MPIISIDELTRRGIVGPKLNEMVNQRVLSPRGGGQSFEITGQLPLAIKGGQEIYDPDVLKYSGVAPPPAGTNLTPPNATNQTPVVTSAGARNEITTGLDNRIAGLELEMPTDDNQLLDAGRKALQSQKVAEEALIAQKTQERLKAQETAGAGIMGQVRANLARFGALNTTTAAVQYMKDTSADLQQEIDRIKGEEQNALLSAQAARDSKDLALVRENIERADTLRKERNDYRKQQQDLQFKLEQERRDEIRLQMDISAEERQKIQSEIDQRQEDRAQQKFDVGRAEDTLKILSDTGAFENFDQFDAEEMTALEQTLGVPKGTLKNYADTKVKMRALEGWESKEYTDRTTGMVTAMYSRINPQTGKPEFMTQALGKFGDRYKPSGGGGGGGGTTLAQGTSEFTEAELLASDVQSFADQVESGQKDITQVPLGSAKNPMRAKVQQVLTQRGETRETFPGADIFQQQPTLGVRGKQKLLTSQDIKALNNVGLSEEEVWEVEKQILAGNKENLIADPYFSAQQQNAIKNIGVKSESLAEVIKEKLLTPKELQQLQEGK